MAKILKPRLNPKQSYLQVALNSTLDEARKIISLLPRSERIIVEAGTPLIKRYGEAGIRQICDWYSMHLAGGILLPSGQAISPNSNSGPTNFFEAISQIGAALATASQVKNSMPKNAVKIAQNTEIKPYVVADLKTMDRAQTEVEMAARAGASAAIALGLAPIETLNSFIEACETSGLDPMIDMMNVEYPLAILHALKKIPPIVIIHRGVDEERLNKEKMIPLHEIRRIKGAYDVMISIAGGDSVREVQRASFNDADIIVVWKSVFESSDQTVDLVNEFLHEIK